MYDLHTHTTKIVRDIVFYETIFPFRQSVQFELAPMPIVSTDVEQTKEVTQQTNCQLKPYVR